MALLGEEVADAYISVHADTKKFRQDLKKLDGSTKSLFRTVGQSAGQAFTKAMNKEFRGVSLRTLGPRLATQIRKLGTTIRTNLSSALSKVGVLIQERIVTPLRNAVSRVGEGFRDLADVVGGQFANQLLRVRVLADRFGGGFSARVRTMLTDLKILGGGFDLYIGDPLRRLAGVIGGQLASQVARVRGIVSDLAGDMRGFAGDIANTVHNMGFLLDPNGWAGIRETIRRTVSNIRGDLDLLSAHFRAAAGRAVEEFRDGFVRLWNSRVVVAARQVATDLGAVIASGFRVGWRKVSETFADLAAIVKLGMAVTADKVTEGGSGISAAFQSVWAKVRRTNRGVVTDVEEVTLDIGEAMVDMVTTVDNSFKGAGKNKGLFIGRMKGARNDFLNIVGSMGGVIERFADKAVTKGLEVVGSAFEQFGAKLFEFGGGSSGGGGLIAGIGQQIFELGGQLASLPGKGGLIGVGLAVAGLAAAAALAVPVLATLVTLMSGLLGIVTALAGSAFMAVSGVLLAIGPAAGAAALGLAAAIIAFKGLTDEQKHAFDPISEWYVATQQMVTDNVFGALAAQVEPIKNILTDFIGPLLVSGSQSLAEVIGYFVEAFQDPNVQATLTTLGETLPPLLTGMGTGLTDMLTGILGFFAPISEAMVPLVDDLTKITGKFSEWANSREGQDQIKQFFADAIQAAKDWWPLISAVSGAVLTLFRQGSETGGEFVTKIADVIQKFTDWANSKEGRETISSWFSFAKDVAEKLWTAIETIGRTLKDLDTPENRAALLGIMGLFNGFLGVVEDTVGMINDLIGALIRLGQKTHIFDGIKNLASGAANIFTGQWFKAGGIPGITSGGLATNSHIRVAEAGREMIVPLVRPLNQVDPSVRAVSAFARGIDPSQFNSGYSNNNAGGKVVNISDGAIRVQVPTDDPEQAASAVLDRLVARWK